MTDINERTVAALKWALQAAEHLLHGADTAALPRPTKPDADWLRYLTFREMTRPVGVEGPAPIVITPEMAWRWMTGEDKTLSDRITELAHLHEERMADPRPKCDLCDGWGRLGDDIPCLACDGSGRVGTKGEAGQA